MGNGKAQSVDFGPENWSKLRFFAPQIFRGLSGSPATSSTPTGQPRRKPAGQMYTASGAVRSAVANQQIGDDAVTRRRRLAGRRRAGTAALAM